MSVQTYKYITEELPVLWNHTSHTSKFLDLLIKTWAKIHDSRDVFRYTIDTIDSKNLNKYLLELNPQRGSKRRSPEHIGHIRQPFDSNLFNFTKVSKDEIIMHVINNNDDNIHSILVNVSPISKYHTLICPYINKCLPQVVTADSLQLCLEIMFLCQNRNIRIGFNSLCALASVNHLHYHFLIESRNLPVEIVKCKHIGGHVYCFDDNYPIPAFCFQVERKENIVPISQDVFKLLEYFINEDIAHNILITRGMNLVEEKHAEEVIRILIWPRKNSFGIKQLDAFNVAVCELSGWFPIYNDHDFKHLQSSDLETELKKWKLDTFDELCSKIKNFHFSE